MRRTKNKRIKEVEQWLTLFPLEEFIVIFFYSGVLSITCLKRLYHSCFFYLFTGEYLWLLSHPGPQLLVHSSALPPPLRRPNMVSEDNCLGCCPSCCKYHNRSLMIENGNWWTIPLPSLEASIQQSFMIRDADELKCSSPDTKSDTKPGCCASVYNVSSNPTLDISSISYFYNLAEKA